MAAPKVEYRDQVSESAIDERFRLRTMTEEQEERLGSLHRHFHLLCRHVLSSCPPSYERDAALQRLDEACGHAKRSIYRHES